MDVNDVDAGVEHVVYTTSTDDDDIALVLIVNISSCKSVHWASKPIRP